MLVVVAAVAPNWNVDFVAAAPKAPPGGAEAAANTDPAAGATDVVAPNAGGLKVDAAVLGAGEPNAGGAVPKPLAPAPNSDELADVLVVVLAPPNAKPPAPNPAVKMRSTSVQA